MKKYTSTRCIHIFIPTNIKMLLYYVHTHTYMHTYVSKIGSQRAEGLQNSIAETFTSKLEKMVAEVQIDTHTYMFSYIHVYAYIYIHVLIQQLGQRCCVSKRSQAGPTPAAAQEPVGAREPNEAHTGFEQRPCWYVCMYVCMYVCTYTYMYKFMCTYA